jgi:hypothetical protein
MFYMYGTIVSYLNHTTVDHTTVPELIDPVLGLFIADTGPTNSGTVVLTRGFSC